MPDAGAGQFTQFVAPCVTNTLLEMDYLMEHSQELQKVGVASIFSSHVRTQGHRKFVQLVLKPSLRNYREDLN